MNSALVVTNLQTDFFTEGKQPIPNSEQILKPINKLIDKIVKISGMVIFVRDWHPPRANFFRDLGEHCVANSQGAMFPNKLNLAIGHSITLNNGLDQQEHKLSAFSATDGYFNLEHYLDKYELKRIFLVGLSLENQIKATALQAIEIGYEVYTISDAVKASSVNGLKETPELLAKNGIKLVTTKEAINLLGRKND
jgi:nicotinamidase/pyrazinamidase